MEQPTPNPVWLEDEDEAERRHDEIADEQSASLEQAKSALKGRNVGWEDVNMRDSADSHLSIHVMKGSERVSVAIRHAHALRLLARHDVAGYELSPTFLGIVNKSKTLWEARVGTRSSGRIPGPWSLPQLGPDSDMQRWEFSNSPDGVSCVLGPPSPEMQILDGASHRMLTLRVSGIEFERPKEADERMENLANSAFFAIDLDIGTPLRLVTRPAKGPRRDRQGLLEAIRFPDRALDQEPMTLYWYARSAYSMPLLQFLAFYQVLEFYFKVFADDAAIRDAEMILKDPLFSVDQRTDVAKLVNSIGLNTRKGRGTEKSQLQTTIEEIATNENLADFLDSDTDMKGALKTKPAGLTTYVVDANKSGSLSTQMADRLYDIRCRIVHTNNDGLNMLLPYSPASLQLGSDIKLLRFLSHRALVNRSSHFQFHSPGPEKSNAP